MDKISMHATAEEYIRAWDLETPRKFVKAPSRTGNAFLEIRDLCLCVGSLPGEISVVCVHL